MPADTKVSPDASQSDASAGARSEAPSRPSGSEGGIKETIESILVAFILAFIFRAFVMEAFVIPTGSMAPTLLGGAHAIPMRRLRLPI